VKDDFIRDSDLTPDAGKPELKHKALFALSDIAQVRGLHALRDGLLAVLPLAAISTIIYILIAAIDLFSKPDLIQTIIRFSATGEAYNPENLLTLKLISPYLAICALIPVLFSIAFTFELSRKYRSGDALPLGLISGLATFIVLYSPLLIREDTTIYDFPLNLIADNPRFLSGGILVAVIVSLFNYGIYRMLVQRGIASPLPANVTEALQGGFRVILPGLVTMIVIIGLVYITGDPFGKGIYYSTLWMTRQITSIYSLIIIVMLVNIFAFFGIQGASSIYSIFWILLFTASTDPPLWGESAANAGFASLSTVFFFVFVGGTGATLSLNLAMLRAGSNQVRKLGAFTFIPSLMNSNDLIIYGLPLAFNRHLLIPFFLVPLVNLGICYLAFSTGFMQAPELFVPPYIPAPLGAFLACGGDWRAIVISVMSILIGWAIYAYFLNPYDLKVRESEEIPEPESRIRRNAI
jgi:PTS system cellobiose-specific IIC component